MIEDTNCEVMQSFLKSFLFDLACLVTQRDPHHPALRLIADRIDDLDETTFELIVSMFDPPEFKRYGALVGQAHVAGLSEPEKALADRVARGLSQSELEEELKALSRTDPLQPAKAAH